MKYYLKKFLVKALSSILDESNNPSSSDLDVSEMKVASYFATNKRSFAYSMSLRGPPRGVTNKLRLWFFVGSWYWLELPDWILEAVGVTVVKDDELSWRVEPVLAPR